VDSYQITDQNMSAEKLDTSSDSLKENQRGASLVEYALLVALIAIVAIVAVRTLGNTVSQQFSAVSNRISG
jgi:pilus assembly protein Flp/PilA